MSMTRPDNYERPLTPDEAFQITVLVNAEMTKNVIMQFNTGDDKVSKYRRNLLKKMDNLIECINQSYKGHVPGSFKERAEIYYNTMEVSMNTLLKSYRAK